jgi:hypothetical protein
VAGVTTLAAEDAAEVPVADWAGCNNSVYTQAREIQIDLLTVLGAISELEAAGETIWDELGIGKKEVE